MSDNPLVQFHKRHDSEDAAEVEATRALDNHPSSTFYVMECVMVVSYPKQPIQITKL